MTTKTTIRLQGRAISEADIAGIRQLIADNPNMSRRRLSIALCESWSWRNARGDLKDMASRSLMLKLHERGLIELPERKRAPSSRMTQRSIKSVAHCTEQIRESLSALQPLRVVNILPKCEDEALFNHLLCTYHYLSYKSSVGENMKYLVFDRHNRPVACLLFGSSAWSCLARDAYLGWESITRQHNINYTTNNTRFLILPWIQVPHLASHILGTIRRRIQQDWLLKYHHNIYLLETFVDTSRFKGTCYRAANWRHVGDTQGRSRNDTNHTIEVPVKSVYLYPLTRKFKEKLSAKISHKDF